jgi:hypothetical protein
MSEAKSMPVKEASSKKSRVEVEAEVELEAEVAVELTETSVSYDRMTVLEHSSRERSLWLGDHGEFSTRWSSFVACAQCGRSSWQALKMKLRGIDEPLLFCDWRCVGMWSRGRDPADRYRVAPL